MAAADPLEDILGLDVDQNHLSAIVGSLESQLASPTSKDSTEHPSSSVNNNHINDSHHHASSPHLQSVSRQSNDLGTGKTFTPVINNVSNASILSNRLHINGNKSSTHASHELHTLPNSVNPALSGASSVTTNDLSSTYLQLPPGQNRTTDPNPLSSDRSTSGVQLSNSINCSEIKSESAHSPSKINCAVIGSTNVGTLATASAVNSMSSNLISVSSNSNTANSSMNVKSEPHALSQLNQPGGFLKTIIQNNATVVKEQLDNRQASKDTKPVLINVVNSSQQVVVKDSHSQPIKTEIKVLSNPAIVSTINSQNLNVPNNISSHNLTKPVPLAGSPTVTVVRPPVSSIPVVPGPVTPNNPATQIQIVSGGQRMTAQMPQARNLAPRTANTPIRIAAAPQSPMVTNPQRSQNMISLPPGFQLPQGAYLVKDSQGQLMVVSGQQNQSNLPSNTPANTNIPNTNTAYKLQNIKENINTCSVASTVVHCNSSDDESSVKVESTLNEPNFKVVADDCGIKVVRHAVPFKHKRPFMYRKFKVLPKKILMNDIQPGITKTKQVYKVIISSSTGFDQVGTQAQQQTASQSTVSQQGVITPSVQSSSNATVRPAVSGTPQQFAPQLPSGTQRVIGPDGVQLRVPQPGELAMTSTGMVRLPPGTTLPPGAGSQQPIIAVQQTSALQPIRGQQSLPQQQQQQLTQGAQLLQKENVMENVKKCKNFLSTLIKLASNQPPETVRNVKGLIQGLIDGVIEPEMFTTKLQVELRSNPQPYLVPFLKKSLPMLRHALTLNKMSIDGVRPPPSSSLRSIHTTGVQPQLGVSITPGQPLHSGMPPHLRGAAGYPMMPPPPPPSHLGPPSSQAAAAAAASTRSPVTGAAAAAGSRLPHAYAAGVRAAAAASSSPAAQTKNLLRAPSTPSSSGAAHARAASSPGSAAAGTPTAAGREKRKYDTVKEDDDINDVATMGGVNLTEESRNILATNSELMSGQLRSCKDEKFLLTSVLSHRLNQIAKKYSLDNVSQDVVSIISHATQERLCNLLERLSVISEHRLETYKTDSRFEQHSDVKSQLKFLEELDGLEKQRHKDQEKEVLLRAAKSRSKTEDPEQAKLKERAKALQQAELEEVRQKEANLTALAAIGPRRKKKGPDTGDATAGSSLSGTTGLSSTGSSLTNRPIGSRPRTKRVTLRDLIFIMEQERESNKSKTLYKAYLK